MISALYNGISGLDSFQKALNTQSNNISNINTVAYKTDKISFVDMMYQNGVGMGTATAEVSKSYLQGDLKLTDSAYDLAIDGVGYFTIYDEQQEETFYTRAGDFKQAVDGNLVTASGKNVQGIPATITGDMIINKDFPNFMASQIVKSPDNIQSINLKASDYPFSAQSEVDAGTGITTKTSSGIVSNIEALKTDYREKLKAYALNPDNVGTASTNQSVDIGVADYATKLTSANDHVIVYIDDVKYTQYFEEDATTTMQLLASQIAKNQEVKDASFNPATGSITVDGVIPGENFNVNTLSVNDVTYFSITDTPGVAGSGQEALNSSYAALEAAVTRANAELKQITTNIDIPPKGTLTTEVVMDVNSFDNLQLNLTALGISDNQFSEFQTENGIIYMVQGDNKFAVGKIPTVAFKNESALFPQGDRLFTASDDAGEPINAAYGSKINGNSLELSNSNMSESLVDLMTFQRAYEANSRSITTSDEFLSIAIQLKK